METSNALARGKASSGSKAKRTPAAVDAPTVAVELESLEAAPVGELRKRYQAMFERQPPEAFGPDLLRRSIAYRLQEDAYGGLSKPTLRLLDRLVEAHLTKQPSNRVAPRRIKAGSMLARDWKGISHHVSVLEDGFAWHGKIWPSLSVIAREITGTRWNGPRFFGLRPDQIAKSPDPVKSSKGVRGDQRQPIQSASAANGR